MQLVKASINEILELQQICRTAYVQVFANHWTDNGLELYLEQEFGSKRLKLELVDDNFEYFFLNENGTNIGFLKINQKSSNEFSELDNCALEKIYILPAYSGKGYGKMAMSEIIEKVIEQGKKLIFLCVIDSNVNAIAFYQKLGFEFHSKTRLEVPYFKKELKGMNRMVLHLSTRK